MSISKRIALHYRSGFITLCCLFVLPVCLSTVRSGELPAGPAKARALFFPAVENEEYIEAGIEACKRLAKEYPAWRGVAITYIGAFKTLKAKYAFWPHDKLAHANAGLEIMDKGLLLAPTNIEALFIHASTCYHLPFFFGRSDEVHDAFQTLVKLLPQSIRAYDAELLCTIIVFLLNNADLPERQQAELNTVKAMLILNEK